MEIPFISKSIIRHWGRWHQVDQFQDRILFFPNQVSHIVVGCSEGEVIPVQEIFIDAICNENIPSAIVVHIKEQRAPTPFRVSNYSHPPDFAKTPIAQSFLQNVSGKLMIVSV